MVMYFVILLFLDIIAYFVLLSPLFLFGYIITKYKITLLLFTCQLIASFLIAILFLKCILNSEIYGNFGYCLKFGLRFSKKACLPSCASSVR